MISIQFAYHIGERVQVKRTGREAKVTTLLHNAQGLNLVQTHDGGLNGGGYDWHREEELQRLEN